VKAITINLLATEHCNLACAHCSTGAPFAKKINHPAESFCKWLDILEAKQIPFTDIAITGGEPFLHPEVRDGSFIRLLKTRYPSKNVGITTNFFWASEKNIVKYAPIIDMMPIIMISMYSEAVDRLGGQTNFNHLVKLLKDTCPNTQITVADQKMFLEWELHEDAREVKGRCITSDCFILKANGELSHCSIAVGAQNIHAYDPIVKKSKDAILDLSKNNDWGREEFLSWAGKYPFDLCFNCTMWTARVAQQHDIRPVETRSYCPVCDARNIRWQPLPNGHINMLKQHGFKHIGSGEMTPLYTYTCPVCGASDRERLYAFFLRAMKSGQEVIPNRMIHFAPESALSQHIRKGHYSASYQTADMSMQGVDFHVDLQSLPFADDHFDFFICSHVLEHVPDDRKAMRELYRVTRPGGLGLLMAPVDMRLATTLEDPSITDVNERWRLFGQDDHLRLYSHDDYVDRIREAGFLLTQLIQDDFGEAVFQQLGLKPSSILYVVSKPTMHSEETRFIPCKAERSVIKQVAIPPKVSVILTSYNHDQFLDEAIQSVLSQTYRNFELIIWDDGSTDDSWSIIQQYNDPRIRAFRNEAPRRDQVNRAISEEIARGEYIAIHHSDDVWELEKLEKQVAFLDQYPETGAVFSWVNIIDNHGNPCDGQGLYERFRQGNKTRYEWLRLFFLWGNVLCHPSVLIRKQYYIECGLYNLALCQLPDFDMWVRLCFKCEIQVLPESLVRFRWLSDKSNTSAITKQTSYRHDFEFYLILDHYCRITSVEEFMKIFPSSEKYCLQPDADLLFALGMTAIELRPSAIHRLFGLSILYKLLAFPEHAEKIRAAYHFDYQDFALLSKQMQIFAPDQPASASKKPASQLDQGILAFRQEDHEKAIEFLAMAMAEEPQNPMPPAYLAFVCAQQGLLQEAHDFITQAIQIAPQRADLVAALGEVFLKSNRPAEAAGYLREAIHAQPDLFAAYPAFAQSLHLTGQSEEAIPLLQTVASLPSDAQANIQSVLLQILVECGDLSEFASYSQRFSQGLPDDLLTARSLARFEENGEALLEALSRVQDHLKDAIHSGQNHANTPPNDSDLTRIAFMVGNFTSNHQLEQLFALFRYLSADRFFTLLITCHTRPPEGDAIQMCSLLTDTVLAIAQDEDNSAVEKLRALAPDILIDLDVCSPSERLAVFLAAPVPHKFLWGEAPIPPIAPDVRVLAGARLGIEQVLPTVTLPELGELFNLPELPLTDKTARKMGDAPVFGCLVPAAGIARNGWQLLAETLRQHPEATLVINLEALGQPAQTFIRKQFANAGVDPARLVFIRANTPEEFCLTWQSIDLGLLPPVHPGGLALPTCLWMGRPCLIPASILPWAQRPAALLKALDREAWIATNPQHYADLALQIAPPGKPVTPDLTLRERMKALGLTDAAGFAQGFTETITALLRNTHSDDSIR